MGGRDEGRSVEVDIDAYVLLVPFDGTLATCGTFVQVELDVELLGSLELACGFDCTYAAGNMPTLPFNRPCHQTGLLSFVSTITSPSANESSVLSAAANGYNAVAVTAFVWFNLEPTRAPLVAVMVVVTLP
mgnify:CR=1 FL=1